MGYRLKRNESIVGGIKRIASEQIDRAIGELQGEALARPKQIHQIRKRCKKLRGLVRLARPGFETTYDQENAWFRDTARLVSKARDVKVQLDTYDMLMEHFSDQVNRQAFGSIRKRLTWNRKQYFSDQVDIDQNCATALRRLQEGRERIVSWSIDGNKLEALLGGLKKTYGRARNAMKETMNHAREQPDAKRFHEWRKRVKYHGYHCRLLENIWPVVMKARSEEASRLSGYLGDEHDLAVLREQIEAEPSGYGSAPDVEAFVALLDERRQRLQNKAGNLGKRLFAEKPNLLIKRFDYYWQAWKCD